jgi:hypothetical protein
MGGLGMMSPMGGLGMMSPMGGLGGFYADPSAHYAEMMRNYFATRVPDMLAAVASIDTDGDVVAKINKQQFMEAFQAAGFTDTKMLNHIYQITSGGDAEGVSKLSLMSTITYFGGSTQQERLQLLTATVHQHAEDIGEEGAHALGAESGLGGLSVNMLKDALAVDAVGDIEPEDFQARMDCLRTLQQIATSEGDDFKGFDADTLLHVGMSHPVLLDVLCPESINVAGLPVDPSMASKVCVW